MKKLILLLVLLMSLACLGAQPCIFRHPYNKFVYQAFIPADNEGIYWHRQDFQRPRGGSTSDTMLPMGQAHFGRVREGKIFCWEYNNITTSGNWFKADIGTFLWGGSGTSGAYCEITLPANHDRVHFTTLMHPNYTTDIEATIEPAGTVITNLSLYTDSYSHIKDLQFTLEPSAEARALRFTNKVNSKILGVVAIHTFDSDSIGDPSTDTGTSPDPNWLGHDIIDAQDVKISSYFTNSPITNDEGIKLYRHNTFEFVVNWKKYGGSSYKWTAYGSHLGTTDAKYTLMDISDGATRDFYTKGPTLLVNGQPAAGTYGHTATDIDYGNIYTGNSITLYAEGFGNFDPADAIGVDDNVLGLNHTVSISKNGIGLQTEMVWFDDGEISTLYSPTLTPEESEQGYVIFPPDTKRYPMLSDYEVHGVSCIELHYDENDKVAVTLSGTAPMSEVFEKGGATEAKLYFRPNLASTHPSGSSPLLGDHYFFGGYLSVKIAFIHPDYLSPEGVDFIDYSFFADHWMLTDCNETNDCDSTDLNFSGSVDSKDFEIFKGYWLSGK